MFPNVNISQNYILITDQDTEDQCKNKVMQSYMRNLR